MNNSKKINVNYSSLVGLKAELLRKQTEVKDAKVNAEPIPTHPKHKVRKKTKSTKLKIGKELIDTDDIKAHKKSKLMLEAKARLYENLKKSHSNKMEHFLVDFERKSESEDEVMNSDDYEDANSDPEEDWIEYEDCFGRTRKCLRRDLSRMQEKDDFVKHEVMKKAQADTEPEDVRPEPVRIIPKEPEIEIMRRKWEEQTEKLADKMNIHYQDVLFDEARAHGVGYYEFSQDEEMRAKQQLNLDALRKETLRKQKEMQDLKESKDKMEQNRLKAARIRQRIRAGLPPEPTEEELKLNEFPVVDNAEAQPEIVEDQESEEKEVVEYKSQNSLVEIENKIKAFGKLLGKRAPWREMTQEEWVHKRRKDRVDEFRPVYSNFKNAGYLHGRNSHSENDEPSSQSDNYEPDTSLLNSCVPKLVPNTDTVTEFEMEKTVSQSVDECDVLNSQSQVAPTEILNSVDTDSSSSDDSDIIGPMPLCPESVPQWSNVQQTFPLLPENVIAELSGIDFSKPPPNMRIDTTDNLLLCPDLIAPTPVPPPNPSLLPPGYHPTDPTLLTPEIPLVSSMQKEKPNSLNTPDELSSQRSLDDDNITAGLKYLRATFEKQKSI